MLPFINYRLSFCFPQHAPLAVIYFGNTFYLLCVLATNLKWATCVMIVKRTPFASFNKNIQGAFEEQVEISSGSVATR